MSIYRLLIVSRPAVLLQIPAPPGSPGEQGTRRARPRVHGVPPGRGAGVGPGPGWCRRWPRAGPGAWNDCTTRVPGCTEGLGLGPGRPGCGRGAQPAGCGARPAGRGARGAARAGCRRWPRPGRGGFTSCTGPGASGVYRRRVHHPRAPGLTPPGAPPRRTSAPPRPVMVQEIAVVLRFGYLFILEGWGAFPLEKGGRILRKIRLNTIYGVFEIGGRGGDGKAMRGREMPERGLNWEGNRLFRGK